jgi:hypothetical protein
MSADWHILPRARASKRQPSFSSDLRRTIHDLDRKLLGHEISLE